MTTLNLRRSATIGGLALALTATVIPLSSAQADTVITGPKNVIVMIGDGMGFNTLDMWNAYTNNEVYYQVEPGGDGKAALSPANAERPTQGFQSWDLVGMSTYNSPQAGGIVYDTTKAWQDFTWVDESPTDSAAAGTALAAGVKTYNAGINYDIEENRLENLADRAKSLGKAAGSISDVEFSHATPASFSAHNINRNSYQEIAHEQVTGSLDVIIGTGHPWYDADGQKTASANYQYISEDDWNNLSSGATDFTFIDADEDFAKLTTGDTPNRVFGVPRNISTLQQGRSEGHERLDIVDLETLTKGALNVLDNNENGFMLMVEAGAIDWTGHANQTSRAIEETTSFVNSVDAVEEWVETNSSWDETLVIVTADHETGHLSGPVEGDFSAIVPQGKGVEPLVSWNSGEHTNQLVPYFYKGAGSEKITEMANDIDLVRGHYIDNIELANWLLTQGWVEKEPSEQPTNKQSPKPSTPNTDIDNENIDGKQPAEPANLTKDETKAKKIATALPKTGVGASAFKQLLENN